MAGRAGDRIDGEGQRSRSLVGYTQKVYLLI